MSRSTRARAALSLLAALVPIPSALAAKSVPLPPEAAKIRVFLDPADQASAKRQGFVLQGEPRLAVVGDWSSADDPEPGEQPAISPSPSPIASPVPAASPSSLPPPTRTDAPKYPEAPALSVSFSFLLPSSVQALDNELRPARSVPAASGSGSQLFQVNMPIRRSSSIARISIISPKGDVTLIPVKIEVDSPQPVVATDPDCASLGIDAAGEVSNLGAAKPAPSAVFVRCVRRGSELSVKLWSWSETRWDPLPDEQRGQWRRNPDRPVIVGKLPLYPEGGITQLTRLALSRSKKEEQKQPASAVLLIHTEARTPSWNISASLGPTWSSYTETAAGLPDIHVTQLGLTAKAQAQFRILPPRWDAALSVFGTVLPLSHDPPSLPSARWIGVNLRAGYQIPLDRMSRNTITLLPGFYAWSMFVSNDAYGVQNLNGPQLVAAASHQQGSRLGSFGTLLRYGGYAKFAIMDRGFSFASPSNHELALGANAVVRFFSLPKPVVFAIDWSTLGFAADGFSMSLSTFSFSIGYTLF